MLKDVDFDIELLCLPEHVLDMAFVEHEYGSLFEEFEFLLANIGIKVRSFCIDLTIGP